MSRLALFLAGALAAAPIAAAQIELTPDEAEQCEAGGGCLVVTRLGLVRAMQAAREAGLATCKGTT